MLVIEKVFLVLYVYAIVLVIVNVTYIMLSALQTDPYIRSWSVSFGSTVPCRRAKQLVDKMSYSDWFLLTLIKANTDTLLFHAFVELYLEEKEKSNRTKVL